jgi:signal peptidase II
MQPNRQNMKYWKYFLVALLVILIDQAVKVIVHYNMERGMPGEIVLLGDWLKFHYTLNPGAAFGAQLNVKYGKLILTLFRIVASIGIVYYLHYLIKHKAPKGLIVCIALILGGAVGNLIDSTFYGIWFDNAPYDAPFVLFHGQVIDMFYIDIWEGIVPNWVPILGGSAMSLWPIFNIADSAIFIGVLIILFNQKRFFAHHEEPLKQQPAEQQGM